VVRGRQGPSLPPGRCRRAVTPPTRCFQTPVPPAQVRRRAQRKKSYGEVVATSSARVNLGRLPGTLVLFCYPRTGRPGEPSLVEDWDLVPGARGCTMQVCSFRDLYAELRQTGIQHVFGLSTQSPEYQREAVRGVSLEIRPSPIRT
jgi:hypothetical protein